MEGQIISALMVSRFRLGSLAEYGKYSLGSIPQVSSLRRIVLSKRKHRAHAGCSMWLDRFSAQSTPAGNSAPSRPYSPGLRKPSHLNPNHRVGLGLRENRSTTSLDLSNNTSNVSLLSAARAPAGSSLRYEQKPAPNVRDPEIVLQSILGREDDAKRGENLPIASIDLDAADLDVDFGQLSLEDYVKHGHQARPDTVHSHPEGPETRRRYEEFHKSISESDGVLNSVEAYLAKFKSELGQVSTEIETLQQRSIQLNGRLENRKQVEKLLGPAVEEISLAPATVRAVSDGPIDDAFMRALTEVEARSSLLDTKKDASNSKAVDDLRPLLDNLKQRAVERIRDYVVAQIKALRSPNVNAQLIQQQHFVKHKDLFAFLARQHPVLAEEIGQAYINTMKWYYSSTFSRYKQSLEKLQVHTFDQSDLLGADPGAKRGGAGKASQPQHDAFGIGKRADVLKATNATAIPSYLAEDSKSSHYLEVPFRHFNQALLDNATTEYTVTSEIFATASYQQVSRKAIEILEPTFTLGHDLTKHLVETTTDCLGILLCLRLNQHFAFELQRHKIPVADSYVNYTNILLWPRFQQVMDHHCESLKKVPTSSNRGAAAAFSLVGGNDASKTSVAPHAITQRFGQLLHGILSLNAEASDDEPLCRSLDRLRAEYEALMTRLSKGAGDASKRSRFLYNNYSLVLTIISDSQGKLAEEQKEHFAGLLNESKGK